ncbi:5'-AMP-activated protein kinase subunit gamma-2 [Eurytemora carolleeae]|uniref:5'-AMP-activated protein kinase subunit gamma-2 n=1 Tax=Eurytemora carolleeae TaxID=1294199 RepID=UPI000C76B4EE|nr:5'-AMP-activated protein kinase subunit gamma-2 [Eurytemora carolleeae]|eukprot:XP_023325852.1 5'-AMP-activated protein kinase subunit gamma-2-like [Eurytemora affinis]
MKQSWVPKLVYTKVKQDVTLAEANQHKTEWFDGVHSCKASDTVLTVIERLVKTDVARLVVVNEEEKVVGIVTVSDVICYLVMRSYPSIRTRRGKIVKSVSCEDLSMKSLTDHSCSPPRWFHV